MRVAFYAPMKPPDDPVPSGDRAMARGLMAALREGGADVTLMSRFRSRDGRGDGAVQAARIADAAAEVDQIAETAAPFEAWVSYHNYYKAPDLIGPAVAARRGVPYLLCEATRARKRLGGPWDRYARAAESACDQAAVIFYLTAQDHFALNRDRPAGQTLIHLRPFLAETGLPAATAARGPEILAAGMMRAGDKLASYTLLAQALAQLCHDDWRLTIAGDGPAQSEVKAAFAGLGPRVRYLGECDSTEMRAAYDTATIFAWPGVNEAFGMVYLEAMSHGLAIAAQDRPGLRDVLPDALPCPTPEDGPAALAARIDALLSDAPARAAEGKANRAHVAARHLLPAASATLMQGLEQAIAGGAA